MLEQQTQAPKPPVQDDDDDEELPGLVVESDDENHTQGTADPAPMSGSTGEFVGHVYTEEDMEDHAIFYRPSSGKKVLVVD